MIRNILSLVENKGDQLLLEVIDKLSDEQLSCINDSVEKDQRTISKLKLSGIKVSMSIYNPNIDTIKYDRGKRVLEDPMKYFATPCINDIRKDGNERICFNCRCLNNGKIYLSSQLVFELRERNSGISIDIRGLDIDTQKSLYNLIGLMKDPIVNVRNNTLSKIDGLEVVKYDTNVLNKIIERVINEIKVMNSEEMEYNFSKNMTTLRRLLLIGIYDGCTGKINVEKIVLDVDQLINSILITKVSNLDMQKSITDQFIDVIEHPLKLKDSGNENDIRLTKYCLDGLEKLKVLIMKYIEIQDSE